MTKDSDFKKLVRQRMAVTGQSYTAAREAMSRPAAGPDLPLTRRVFGVKTSCVATLAVGEAPDAIGAAEYLFRQMVPRGGAGGVYLENGARIRLRPGEPGPGQLAYATPECDSIVALVAAERAGHETIARLATRYRRLKVTGAGAGTSQLAMFLRLGATEQVLRLAESSAELSVGHGDYARSTPRAPSAPILPRRGASAAARKMTSSSTPGRRPWTITKTARLT